MDGAILIFPQRFLGGGHKELKKNQYNRPSVTQIRLCQNTNKIEWQLKTQNKKKKLQARFDLACSWLVSTSYRPRPLALA